LLVKELRESLPLAALGALGVVYAITQLTGWTIYPGLNFLDVWEIRVPFVKNDDFISALMPIGLITAAATGLKQTAWEAFNGTFQYLLFKPATRSTIMAVKMLLGLALVQTISAALIIWYAAWAARQGNLAAPFQWSMTSDAWRAWSTLPVAYLAAFLSGMRPARWFGTKLAPLAAGFMACVCLAIQPWWWLALPGTAVLSVLLALAILHLAAVRDY
jgi:hypothetical protein